MGWEWNYEKRQLFSGPQQIGNNPYLGAQIEECFVGKK
jgi:hypothetical protein